MQVGVFLKIILNFKNGARFLQNLAKGAKIETKLENKANQSKGNQTKQAKQVKQSKSSLRENQASRANQIEQAS